MAWQTVEKSNVRIKFVENETVTLVQANPAKGIEKITSVNEDGRVTDIISFRPLSGNKGNQLLLRIRQPRNHQGFRPLSGNKGNQLEKTAKILKVFYPEGFRPLSGNKGNQPYGQD